MLPTGELIGGKKVETRPADPLDSTLTSSTLDFLIFGNLAFLLVPCGVREARNPKGNGVLRTDFTRPLRLSGGWKNAVLLTTLGRPRSD